MLFYRIPVISEALFKYTKTMQFTRKQHQRTLISNATVNLQTVLALFGPQSCTVFYVEGGMMLKDNNN